MTAHRLLGEDQLHEPKGVSLALADQVYISDGAGSGVWSDLAATNVAGSVTQGWWDYHDVTTQTTAIPLSVANTGYFLTNDGAGANTNKTFALAGLVDIWDTATNRFQFSEGSVLAVGDTGSIRVDIDVTTTSANTEFEIYADFALGTASNYQLPIITKTNIKTAGTYRLVGELNFYIGNTDTLTAPAAIMAKADTTGAELVVNGWYIRTLKTN